MKALIIAFSMYSRIPMPFFQWEEKDRKKAMCYFPMVGLVEGLVFLAVFLLFDVLKTGNLFRGAVLMAVPILITGGIHLDGFMDTTDALASYGDREKKLAILKDSHNGAFAVIHCIVLLLLLTGCYGEAEKKAAVLIASGFLLSRTLSGLTVVTIQGAREHGMLADFMKDSNRKMIFHCLFLYPGFLLLAVFLTKDRFLMTGVILELVLMVFGYFLYRKKMIKEFGGVTGDLSGWLLQTAELLFAILAVILQKLFMLGGIL